MKSRVKEEELTLQVQQMGGHPVPQTAFFWVLDSVRPVPPIQLRLEQPHLFTHHAQILDTFQKIFTCFELQTSHLTWSRKPSLSSNSFFSRSSETQTRKLNEASAPLTSGLKSLRLYE